MGEVKHTLDHGSLNVPLAKRGNIDAQIDRYKAQQAAVSRSARVEAAAVTKANRVEAKRLYAVTSPERFAALAAHCGQPVAAVKRQVLSDCHWQPALVIKLLAAAEWR